MAKIKRLVIDMNNELHKEIKMRASHKYITMKAYVLRAIVKQIEKDNLLEFEEAVNLNQAS